MTCQSFRILKKTLRRIKHLAVDDVLVWGQTARHKLRLVAIVVPILLLFMISSKWKGFQHIQNVIIYSYVIITNNSSLFWRGYPVFSSYPIRVSPAIHRPGPSALDCIGAPAIRVDGLGEPFPAMRLFQPAWYSRLYRKKNGTNLRFQYLSYFWMSWVTAWRPAGQMEGMVDVYGGCQWSMENYEKNIWRFWMFHDMSMIEEVWTSKPIEINVWCFWVTCVSRLSPLVVGYNHCYVSMLAVVQVAYYPITDIQPWCDWWSLPSHLL